MMTRTLSLLAFALGALIIAWMGSAFVNGNLLALSVTLVIASVYLGGFAELWGFQRASRRLSDALQRQTQPVSDLDRWLQPLPASLRDSVRLRITSERSALPGPVLTPYLVGLLVMLGLIGTFVGMVETLKGAVGALEGTSDLEAIRSGLAAPIKGLGMAFGTSVAGVAGSAILGFISTLSRRERLLVSRLLDHKMGSVLQQQSLAYHRDQTYKAIQVQAHALPAVAEQLMRLAERVEQGNSAAAEGLAMRQQAFQADMQQAFTGLAASLNQSFQQTLGETGRLVGESLQPLIGEMMGAVGRDIQATHQQLADTVNQQLNTLTDQFSSTAASVSQAWQSGLAAHEQANQGLLQALGESLQGFTREFTGSAAEARCAWQSSVEAQAETNAELVTRLGDAVKALTHDFEVVTRGAAAAWQQGAEAQQQQADAMLDRVGERLQTLAGQFEQLTARADASWHDGLQAQQQANAALLAQVDSAMQGINQQFITTAATVSQSWQGGLDAYSEANIQLLAQMQQAVASLSQQVGAAASGLTATFDSVSREWQVQQQAGDEQRLQQWTHAFSQASGLLQETATKLAASTESRSTQLFEGMAGLLQSTEQLLEARNRAETTWLQATSERTELLTASLRQEFAVLRADESARADAAVARLDELQAAVAGHLASLGQTLEAPMAKLLEMSAEVPRAAAEVIAQLRSEISNSIERDNQLLGERQRIMQELDSLAVSLAQSSGTQRDAIESLVQSSANMLTEVGNRFSEGVGSDVNRLTEMVDHFASGAIELSVLGESFGAAVQMFNESNQQLQDSLSRIETSLQDNADRGDEQMAYYVAQAREIIDHNLLSQQELIEQLRTLSRSQSLSAADA